MDNKGVILITVLWVLVILSLIAWGLGRRSSLEVSLLETYRGKLRSTAAARAGLSKVLDMMQRSPTSKDTLYATAISIDAAKTPADIFARIDTGPDTYAIIQWPARNYSTGDSKSPLEYGLRDEAAKININAINVTNFQILSALLQEQGLTQPQADKLAMAVVNYTGTGAATTNGAFFDMDDALLKPKNKPYENLLELLEVNGMTKEIFDKIKDEVTVYGNAQNGLWINTDTADNAVLQAVANATSRVNPSITAADIISQATTIRDGADSQSLTQDDGATSIASITNPNWPSALQEGKSGFYKARVVGVDKASGTRTVLEAVISGPQGGAGEIVSWQRN